MTCIVGLLHRGVMWMGGDSAATTESGDLDIRAEPKVVRNKHYLIGGAGSPRVIDIVQNIQDFPSPPKKNLRRFMINEFVPIICKHLIEQKCKDPGDLLIAARNELFLVGCDFQVGQNVEPFYAIGAGGSYAFGSLYSTDGMAPKKRVLLALQAAERYHGTVRGPFRILRMREAR